MATPGTNYFRMKLHTEFADNSTMANQTSHSAEGNIITTGQFSKPFQCKIGSTLTYTAYYDSLAAREGVIVIHNVTGAWTTTTGHIEVSYNHVPYGVGVVTTCYQLIPPNEFCTIWMTDRTTDSGQISLYAPSGDAYAEIYYAMTIPAGMYPP